MPQMNEPLSATGWWPYERLERPACRIILMSPSNETRVEGHRFVGIASNDHDAATCVRSAGWFNKMAPVDFVRGQSARDQLGGCFGR